GCFPPALPDPRTKTINSPPFPHPQIPTMSTATQTIQQFVSTEYKYGFVSDSETETLPPGLNEEIIRGISAKKKEPEFMLQWRLRAYRHWLTMTEPTWQQPRHAPVDYQKIIYYAAPKPKKQ